MWPVWQHNGGTPATLDTQGLRYLPGGHSGLVQAIVAMIKNWRVIKTPQALNPTGRVNPSCRGISMPTTAFRGEG